MPVVNITANINSILMLNGSNFKSWQENILIVLLVMDLNLALSVDIPPPLTDKGTFDYKRDIERYERSNSMCIIIMKKVIPEALRDLKSEKVVIAKQFLTEIEQRFVKNEKAEIGTLLTSPISIRYKGKDKGRKGTRIRKLQIQHLKRNNKRNRMIQKPPIVSFAKLKEWFGLL